MGGQGQLCSYLTIPLPPSSLVNALYLALGVTRHHLRYRVIGLDCVYLLVTKSCSSTSVANIALHGFQVGLLA